MIQFISGVTIYIFLNALYMRKFYKFGKRKSAFEVGIIEVIFPIPLGLLAQFGILDSIIGLTATIFVFTAWRFMFSNWQTHLIFAFSISLSFSVLNNSISFWVSQEYHYEISIALLLFVSMILRIIKKGIRICYTTNFVTNTSWIFRAIVITIILNVGLHFLKLNEVVLIVENVLLFIFLALLIILNVRFRRVLKEVFSPMTPEMEIELKSILAEYENKDKE